MAHPCEPGCGWWAATVVVQRCSTCAAQIWTLRMRVARDVLREKMNWSWRGCWSPSRNANTAAPWERAVGDCDDAIGNARPERRQAQPMTRAGCGWEIEIEIGGAQEQERITHGRW
eukprot:scaffold15909_cov128-Isochrysis_galbana.AAC.4